jgi:EpsI family protein
MKTKLNSIISWRYGLLLASLIVGGLFINLWERAGEARVARRELKEFPAQLGQWRQAGSDQRFDPEVENVLLADDYVSRTYAMPDGRLVSVYIGYYATQRTGATYHSPLNCLPGSGWTLYDPARIEIKSPDGSRAFEANRFIVQNMNDRQLLIYWYQGRGRAVASEYWDKVFKVIDSARRRRSDGAMVRLTTSAVQSETEALKIATDLAGQLATVLPDFVPD